MKKIALLLFLLFAMPLFAQNIGSKIGFSELTGEGIDHSSVPSFSSSSVEANKSPKLLRHPALKISLGVVSLAACVAGVVFDSKIKGKADENNQLRNEYKALPDNLQYDDYSLKMKGNLNSANKYSYLRDGSYILAGLGVVGFAITFAF